MQPQAPPLSDSPSPSPEHWASAQQRGDLFKQEHLAGVKGQEEGGDDVESKEQPLHVAGVAMGGDGAPGSALLKTAGLRDGQSLVQGPRLQLTVPAPGVQHDLPPDTPPPITSSSQSAAAGAAAMQSQTQGEPAATEPAAAADSAEAGAAVAAAGDADGHASSLAGVPAHLPAGLHHLTRHWLPEGQRGEAVLRQLGAADLKAADHLIKSMGQRDLRLAFQKVYNCTTQSYNNNWLRRKLMEAVGLKATPSPRHGRGGSAGAAPAAAGAAGRARGGRQPPRRAPTAAAAAAASQPRTGPSSAPAAQQQLIIGEVGKKVTRKAAAEAAEADAIAALRTMMAGGFVAGSWGTASADDSWGEAEEVEGREEDGEEEEGPTAEELAPNGCQGQQQLQQQQQPSQPPSQQQQQQQQPLPLVARWEDAAATGQNGSNMYNGNGVLGGAEGCGFTHAVEGKRSWREEEGQQQEGVDGERAGSEAPSRTEPRSVQMRRGGSHDEMKGGPGWQNGKHIEEEEEEGGEEREGEGQAALSAQPQQQQHVWPMGAPSRGQHGLRCQR